MDVDFKLTHLQQKNTFKLVLHKVQMTDNKLQLKIMRIINYYFLFQYFQGFEDLASLIFTKKPEWVLRFLANNSCRANRSGYILTRDYYTCGFGSRYINITQLIGKAIPFVSEFDELDGRASN